MNEYYIYCIFFIRLQTEYEFEEHPSVATLLNSKKQSTDVTLQECFDLYFNEENVSVNSTCFGISESKKCNVQHSTTFNYSLSK